MAVFLNPFLHLCWLIHDFLWINYYKAPKWAKYFWGPFESVLRGQTYDFGVWIPELNCGIHVNPLTVPGDQCCCWSGDELVRRFAIRVTDAAHDGALSPDHAANKQNKSEKCKDNKTTRSHTECGFPRHFSDMHIYLNSQPGRQTVVICPTIRTLNSFQFMTFLSTMTQPLREIAKKKRLCTVPETCSRTAIKVKSHETKMTQVRNSVSVPLEIVRKPIGDQAVKCPTISTNLWHFFSTMSWTFSEIPQPPQRNLLKRVTLAETWGRTASNTWVWILIGRTKVLRSQKRTD